MSTVETPPTESMVACPRCGTPLRADQDWCLSCGTAVTTHVAGASGWRTPVMVVGAVLLLALAGLAVAFLELSDDADRAAQAPPAETPTPAPTATPTPAATTTPEPGETPTPTPEASPTATPEAGEVASWPSGVEAWTVILKSTGSEADAERSARELQAAGQTVGVLKSDDYTSLRPGFWVVFSGQYDKQEDAQAAAAGFAATAPDAYARFVEPK